MNSLPLAWRLALRELRAGLAGFRVFLACLILGVAAIAGIGSVSESVIAGIRADARTLLGGDIDLRLTPARRRPSSVPGSTRTRRGDRTSPRCAPWRKHPMATRATWSS
jgi:predicted lysophospholipase L1 biosynthesis ABC-type transport system permease subunit